jgi:hypothetical protein
MMFSVRSDSRLYNKNQWDKLGSWELGQWVSCVMVVSQQQKNLQAMTGEDMEDFMYATVQCLV